MVLVRWYCHPQTRAEVVFTQPVPWSQWVLIAFNIAGCCQSANEGPGVCFHRESVNMSVPFLFFHWCIGSNLHFLNEHQSSSHLAVKPPSHRSTIQTPVEIKILISFNEHHWVISHLWILERTSRTKCGIRPIPLFITSNLQPKSDWLHLFLHSDGQSST